jgi:MFS family permease
MRRSLRNTFSFMHGNVLVLTVTRVMGMFCRSMVFPYASLYILALGGEPAQIGFINSLRPLAGLIAFPIAGYLADRAGRVRLIALTGYFSGAILLLYVLARCRASPSCSSPLHLPSSPTRCRPRTAPWAWRR